MATGTRTTYTDTDIRVRAIGDIIHNIDWADAPLLNKFGLTNESKFRLKNWPSTSYEWLNDTLSPRASVLAESGFDDSETDLTVTTGHGVYFKEGDILKVENELMYVSSVATDVLTVVRGFGSTTPAAHAQNVTVTLATVARLEGADYDTGHTTTVTSPGNYTQIFAEAVKVTGSEAKETKYGVADTMSYHIEKLIGGGRNVQGTRFRAGKLPILLQQTFYYGKSSAGSASVARAMAGFEGLVTTNVTNLSSAALTRKNIEDLMQTIFLGGGNPDTIIVNAWLRRKISSFYEGSIRTERSETRGGARIDTIVTDFGEMEVMFDRWCPTDRLYMVESDKIGWLTYRPFNVYDRPSTGDYEVKEVLGEFGFVVSTELSHGYLYGASTTA